MDIINRLNRLLKNEETVTTDVADNPAKIGTKKKDGSGKGIRANKGRGGCSLDKQKKKKKGKKSKLTGLLQGK